MNASNGESIGHRDPFVIANYLIENYHGIMRPLQLIKLVYIAHGWFLAFTKGIPLLREPVQAWKYGPVVPSLYHAVKGNREIAEPFPMIQSWKDVLHQDERGILDETLEFYGHFTGRQLSSLTHEKGTPWDETWDGTFHKDIPNKSIEAYYLKLSKGGENDSE